LPASASVYFKFSHFDKSGADAQVLKNHEQLDQTQTLISLIKEQMKEMKQSKLQRKMHKEKTATYVRFFDEIKVSDINQEEDAKEGEVEEKIPIT